MRTLLTRTRTAWCGLVLCSVSLFTGACRDSLTPGVPAAPAPSPDARGRAYLVVDTMPNDSTVLVSLHVTAPGAMPLVSVSAGLSYDTTQLRYVGEVRDGDGALRVSNAVRGLLNTAAAHATGFPHDTVATWRFTVRGSRVAASRGLSLQLRELRSADAANARPRTDVTATVVTTGMVRP